MSTCASDLRIFHIFLPNLKPISVLILQVYFKKVDIVRACSPALIGAPVQFHLSDIFKLEFTKKSKLKSRKDLEPYLFESQTIILPDKNNKLTKAENFRQDEVIQVCGKISY